MATRNDITNDVIKSKVSNKNYRDNFEGIFKKKKDLEKVEQKKVLEKSR